MATPYSPTYVGSRLVVASEDCLPKGKTQRVSYIPVLAFNSIPGLRHLCSCVGAECIIISARADKSLLSTQKLSAFDEYDKADIFRTNSSLS